MYITFDIGGTNTRIARSLDGKTLDAVEIYSTSDHFDRGVMKFIAAIKELSEGKPITAIAGGIAGPLDKNKTMAIGGPNIKGWWNQPVKKVLAETLDVPVYLENDAVMGALGEANFGAGRDKEIVVYMTISTGVGGARVVNGVIDESSMGFEPGFMIIDAGNALCEGCSEKGYLIDYVSGAAAERIMGKPAYEITDPEFWNKKAEYLAYGLNNVIMLWSPDIIVLGGSMMKKMGIPIDQVQREVAKAQIIFNKEPDIVHARFDDEMGLWGALALLKQKGH